GCAPHMLRDQRSGKSATPPQAPSKKCRCNRARERERQDEGYRNPQIRKARFTACQFKDWYKQNQRDWKMNRKGMKAPDNLRPRCALRAIGWQNDQKDKQQHNGYQDNEREGAACMISVRRSGHELSSEKNKRHHLREQFTPRYYANTSATTRAGLTL